MTDDTIPPFTLAPEIETIGEDILAAIRDVMRSGAFILGPTVEAFENRAADYLGVKHAIGCNSGTDALIIALRAFGIGSDDEVIVPSFSFFATAESVSAVGATPVFIDIEPNSFCMDPTRIESAITDKTKAIIPVHLFGHAADMDPIQAIASQHGLKILEDAAQGFGGLYKAQKLGSLSDAAAFSFYPTKNLGGYGDGGLITTNDAAVADMCRMLRAHGSKRRYMNDMIAYNSRLDAIQAAILNVKLPYLDSYCNARRAAALRYNDLLKNVPQVTIPQEADYAHHVYHQYTIRLHGVSRDRVREKMLDAGVIPMIYYPIPIHRLDAYRLNLDLPVTDRAAECVLSLPIWPQITPETQERVVNTLTAAL